VLCAGLGGRSSSAASSAAGIAPASRAKKVALQSCPGGLKKLSGVFSSAVIANGKANENDSQL